MFFLVPLWLKGDVRRESDREIVLLLSLLLSLFFIPPMDTSL